ncbi:MFS transporter [Spiractinospora alimapuensis]|uniref:MFS transporter n=1 Tax=Spiractinospora alimapuensis TaxID=2820884 RepID=UPI0022AA9F54|nr:MFS transporter [Spiractinospora alimapuensis]
MTSTVAAPDPIARRARRSVTALFAVNAMTYASVVPWYPSLKSSLELSNAALGASIAAMPLGAILTGMLAGPLIARLGSGATAVWSGMLTAIALPIIAIAPSAWVFAAALFGLGCVDAWADSAMNSHGLRVQRRYGRSIINSFHATWSVFAVVGGLLGATAVGLGVPMVVHTSVTAVLLILAMCLTVPGLLSGAEDTERAAEAGSRPAPTSASRWPAPRAVGLILALGTLLMLAAAVEDSAPSWGAVYMRTELAASAFVAGMPFVACQALMTSGRLVGDRLTDRFGAATVARAGTLVAAFGLGVALLWPTQFTTVLGFGLCGLGVATLFPLALSTAGNVPGVRSGDGVTAVAWLARIGFLAFPPAVGFIADASSLRVGLIIIPLGAVAAFFLSSALRPRN